MIKSITLKNFQSHKLSTLNFSEGVNVLHGLSRHGKTAIARGLFWLMKNRPSGEAFRSHWAKNDVTKIVVETNDNDQIVRLRDSSKNLYKLNDEVYEAFGQEVPESIREALNFSDLNIQFQMDQPFLIDWSPPEAARYLNRLVHLDEIDIAVEKVASLKRRNAAQIAVAEERVKELETQMDAFPDLEAAEEFISGLEEQEKELNQKIVIKYTLDHCLNSLETVEYEIAITELPKGIEAKIQGVEKKQERLEQLAYTQQLLIHTLNKIQEIDSELLSLQLPKDIEKKVIKLEAKILELNMKRGKANKLNDILYAIDSVQGNIDRSQKYVEENEKKFKQLRGEVCPLCERLWE